MGNEINAEVKFIEVGGKFIWKIYDANGSVVEKAKEMFDNKEACEADFNAFCENSETVGIEDINPADEVETPVAPEVETAPEVATEISEEVIENQPVEQSQPETAIETEVKTEVAPEGAIEGSAEGIETAKL